MTDHMPCLCPRILLYAAIIDSDLIVMVQICPDWCNEVSKMDVWQINLLWIIFNVLSTNHCPLLTSLCPYPFPWDRFLAVTSGVEECWCSHGFGYMLLDSWKECISFSPPAAYQRAYTYIPMNIHFRITYMSFFNIIGNKWYPYCFVCFLGWISILLQVVQQWLSPLEPCYETGVSLSVPDLFWHWWECLPCFTSK